MPQPNSAFLPGIQYLRGFAALYVVLYHLNGDFAFPLLAYGYLGVQLFFVISGFIITYVHSQDRGFASLKKFIVRRFTRIYPAYWAALLPVLLLFFTVPGIGLPWHTEPLNVIRNFLLLQNPDQSILGVAWSLVYEIMFYTIFGVWVIGLRWPIHGLLVGWALLLTLLSWWAPALTTRWLVLDSYNSYFLAGCTLALIYPYTQRRLSLAYFVAALLLFLAVPFFYNTFWAIFGASLLLCTVATLYQPVQPYHYWLILGDASYALYLTHLTIIAIVTSVIQTPWVMAPLFVLCVLIGLGFYYWVESFLRDWIKTRWLQPRVSVVSFHP